MQKGLLYNWKEIFIYFIHFRLKKRSEIVLGLLSQLLFLCEYITIVRKKFGKNPESDRDYIKRSLKRKTEIEMKLNWNWTKKNPCRKGTNFHTLVRNSQLSNCMDLAIEKSLPLLFFWILIVAKTKETYFSVNGEKNIESWFFISEKVICTSYRLIIMTLS